MKEDKNMPEYKNDDKAICNHIYWESRADIDVERTVKEALKKYSEYKKYMHICREKE